MKLVIAEKPSVAISIAKVIGATKKKDGYYEGNGYKVSWCVGHLIQIANPDSYDEKYAKWNMADLPIIPKEYKYEIAKSTKKQFTIPVSYTHLDVYKRQAFRPYACRVFGYRR